MRKWVAEQPPLVTPPLPHKHVRELREMAKIPEAHPEMAAWVHDDIVRGLNKPEVGREGLESAVVLRAQPRRWCLAPLRRGN